MDIAIPILTALAAAGATVAALSARLSLRPKPSVVVHTQDSQTIQGVLLDANRTRLVLAHPEYLSGVKPTGIAGRVIIPAANYAWHQEIPAGALGAADAGGG